MSHSESIVSGRGKAGGSTFPEGLGQQQLELAESLQLKLMEVTK